MQITDSGECPKKYMYVKEYTRSKITKAIQSCFLTWKNKAVSGWILWSVSYVGWVLENGAFHFLRFPVPRLAGEVRNWCQLHVLFHLEWIERAALVCFRRLQRDNTIMRIDKLTFSWCRYKSLWVCKETK